MTRSKIWLDGPPPPPPRGLQLADDLPVPFLGNAPAEGKEAGHLPRAAWDGEDLRCAGAQTTSPSPKTGSLVQFHPSYRGLSGPKRQETAKPELRNGPLLRAAERARQEPEAGHYLVIDEINRGNLAKVFGELYFLGIRDEGPFSIPSLVLAARCTLGTMNTAGPWWNVLEFHPDKEPVEGVLRAGGRGQTKGWLLSLMRPTSS